MKHLSKSIVLRCSALLLGVGLLVPLQSCRSCAQPPPQGPQALVTPTASTDAPLAADSPVATVDSATPDPAPTAPLAVHTGCFAWSESLHSALCVTGQWGHGREREWTTESFAVVQSGRVNFSAVFMDDNDGQHTEDPLAPEQLAQAPMLTSSNALLSAEVQRGRYTAFDFHDQPIGQLRGVSPDLNYRWQFGTIRVHRTRVQRAGRNQAPRYTDQISIQWTGSTEWISVAEHENEPVETAQLRALVLPGGEQLLIVSERAWGEEGAFAKMINIAECDHSTRMCR